MVDAPFFALRRPAEDRSVTDGSGLALREESVVEVENREVGWP